MAKFELPQKFAEGTLKPRDLCSAKVRERRVPSVSFVFFWFFVASGLSTLVATLVAAAITIRPFAPADAEPVVALWRACGLTRPQNDPHKDIARKLRVNPEWFLVAERAGEIVGTAMAGYEGHRGWINYLAVAPAWQRSGLGRRLMDEAEARLRAAGCPKINLQVRPDNQAAIAFYERIGFTVEGAISLGKRLEHDA